MGIVALLLRGFCNEKKVTFFAKRMRFFAKTMTFFQQDNRFALQKKMMLSRESIIL